MVAELSIWQLTLTASPVVKSVMLILLGLSICSWAFIIQRIQILRRARAELSDFESAFWSGHDLNRLYNELSSKAEAPDGVAAIFVAGFREFGRLRKQKQLEPTAIMAAAQRAMHIAQNKACDALETHLSFFATVGSVSPYIGLFGTVWGIMHAMTALGQVEQATLSMVAPGIAEALVATAMGLFAAIPAYVAYNKLSLMVDRLNNHYLAFQEEFTNILHRQAHSNNT